MKKLTTIFILSLVLFSCTTENELVYQNHSTTVSKQAKRSLTEALEIAQEAASLFDNKSRSGEVRTIDMKNIQYLHSEKKSRSQGDDTLLYVINYTDNNGFAVVSANPNTAGLIAVTEKGSYSPTSEEINNNTGMNMFMDMAEIYVSGSNNELQNTGPVPMLEIMERVDTTDTYVLPKLTTEWGQTFHEGKYCSNGVSGCANTALAQIMAYFEYPTQMNITYESAPISILNLDWSEIKKYKSIYDDSADETAHDAIGYLCRQLGKLTNSEYKDSLNLVSTSTATSSALDAISLLGYNTSANIQIYENTSFSYALSNNNLVFMVGGCIEENRLVGHAWIIDGHLERELHYRAYTRQSNSELWQLHDEHYT